MTEARRPHTGRRRNEAAREAILDAATRLLGRTDGAPVTVNELAAEAGVGKQTIYRWWTTKGEVFLEAMDRMARTTVPVPATGSLHADLESFLTATFRGAQTGPVAAVLRALAGEAGVNPHVAELLREFTRGRREVLQDVLCRGRERGELAADADLDLMVDQVFGLLWYRMLLRHRQFGPDTAARLTRSLIHGNA